MQIPSGFFFAHALPPAGPGETAMTVKEAGVWIEQHYGEMFAVAVRRAMDLSPEDILQSAIATMLASKVLPRVREHNQTRDRRYMAAWPFATLAIKQAAFNARRAAHTQSAVRGELKNIGRSRALHGRTGGGKQNPPAKGSDL